MLAWARRSGLTVKEETPASYLPEPTPAMIESNGAVWNSAFNPSLAATRLKRSTSKPSIVEPSAARNSLGAYVVSLPTEIFPSADTAAGTFAARAGSAETLGSGVPELPSPPEDDEEESLPPQPARRRTPVTAVARAAVRPIGCREVTAATLLREGWPQILLPAPPPWCPDRHRRRKTGPTTPSRSVGGLVHPVGA